jgi:hypothetical protein
MLLLKRMEKKIAKIIKNIEEKQKQIEKLRIEYKKHMLADYDFISQKKRIEDKIRDMNLKLGVLRDEMVKKKKHQDEKAKEREEQKRREKNYFECCKNMKILKIKEVK